MGAEPCGELTLIQPTKYIRSSVSISGIMLLCAAANSPPQPRTIVAAMAMHVCDSFCEPRSYMKHCTMVTSVAAQACSAKITSLILRSTQDMVAGHASMLSQHCMAAFFHSHAQQHVSLPQGHTKATCHLHICIMPFGVATHLTPLPWPPCRSRYISRTSSSAYSVQVYRTYAKKPMKFSSTKSKDRPTTLRGAGRRGRQHCNC